MKYCELFNGKLNNVIFLNSEIEIIMKYCELFIRRLIGIELFVCISNIKVASPRFDRGTCGL